ncbi:MAG: hypothetical protein JO227_04925 [Acetobacteraceae bacterium]|nr:hypothetical protein [Acetobacteraceae bacterium]
MRRVLAACIASLLLYATAFAIILDRPLALGFLRAEIEAKLARAAAVGSPKLVILSGSNGPYSHRCQVMEPQLNRPCVNGGVAVGIGLDYLFARWKPLLHPGDIVYLPMEEAQYVRSREATAVGPDAAIMLRHDRATLAALPEDRWAGALFASGPRGAVMSLIEMALDAGGFHDPRAAVTGETNAWGDHVGHTAQLASFNTAVLAAAVPYHPSAAAIRDGYGTQLIAAFIGWAQSHGVRVIGGLPTGFADSPMTEAELQAIRSVYLQTGGSFLELGNRSRYPREAFFDTPDHLNEMWQIRHSIAVARALAQQNRPLASRAGF